MSSAVIDGPPWPSLSSLTQRDQVKAPAVSKTHMLEILDFFLKFLPLVQQRPSSRIGGVICGVVFFSDLDGPFSHPFPIFLLTFFGVARKECCWCRHNFRLSLDPTRGQSPLLRRESFFFFFPPERSSPRQIVHYCTPRPVFRSHP